MRLGDLIDIQMNTRPSDARQGALASASPFTVVCGDRSTEIHDLTDDSRQVKPGSLFIARGAPFEAEVEAGCDVDTAKSGGAGFDALKPSQFIVDAIDRGAVAVVLGSGIVASASGGLDKRAKVGVPSNWLDCYPQIAWVTAAVVDQPAAGQLAERFFGYPSKQIKVIGITGTNGKTTTAFIIQHLLNATGSKCGMIGTVVVDDGKSRVSAPLTTPGAVEFSRSLYRMVHNGCDSVVAELSSHALDQGRAAAVTVDVAVFTNLTGDHLDYHETMDAYADAKATLFKQLAPSATAVINGDSEASKRMTRDCKAKIVFCCVHESESSPSTDDVAAISCAKDTKLGRCDAQVIQLGADGSKVRIAGALGVMDVQIPLVGQHNVANVLQAAAAAHALKSDVVVGACLHRALETCPGVPGRLEPTDVHWGETTSQGLDIQGHSKQRVGGIEPVVTSKDSDHDIDSNSKSNLNAAFQDQLARQSDLPTVLVDYAHTHDALENVLRALRPLTGGRLITVFGCGGDRDSTKRPKMANAACVWSDVVIITSDNPRTEDPAVIINDVLQGVPAGLMVDAGREDIANADQALREAVIIASDKRTDLPKMVHVQADRAEAIALAISLANEDDVVLLAGKGHEDYQIIGSEKRPFDDRLHAAAALRQRVKTGEPLPRQAPITPSV
jgi:UDP-N-acetylmuramoyl-L-alanyl-D-glutamate--2,6-diaminopimelate ligase